MPTASPRLCSRCRRPCRGRCPNCTTQQRADTDQARGSSTSRGYGSHWRRVIRPAFLRDNPLCVLCGALAEVPDHWPETRASLVARGVTDPDAAHRLRPLCAQCHNRHGLSYKPWAKQQATLVVAGPPCSGKNTYVNQHRRPGDPVIDYDEIMARLTGRPLYHHDEAAKPAVIAERDDAIARLLASGQRGWIIASAPRAEQRHQHNTRVVLLLATQATALQRARNTRPTEWTQYIKQWYRDYTASPRDTIIPTDDHAA